MMSTIVKTFSFLESSEFFLYFLIIKAWDFVFLNQSLCVSFHQVYEVGHEAFLHDENAWKFFLISEFSKNM